MQDEECEDHKNANCTKIITCGETGGSKEFCYALWKNESGQIEFLKRGCFADKPCAGNTDCIGEPHSTGIYYCCCSGDLCNRNISNITITRTHPSAGK